MARRALITGVLGQDGAYLAEQLLDKGYEVHGGHRRDPAEIPWRLEERNIASRVHLLELDLLKLSDVQRAVQAVQPDELYNLAAQSMVGLSFEQPLLTSDVNALGTARLLEAVRLHAPRARFCQASTSEMFGAARSSPQDEETPFHPRNPYAVSKVYAHHLTVNYRETYGLHASTAILFNHESPLRGPEFVTRKITHGLARVAHGRQDCVELGNLDAQRDWGFAGDTVDGLWRILQQPGPGDYVLATGILHSVREFCQLAAAHAGFDLAWEGAGVDARGVDRSSGRTIVRVNPRFYRPVEADALVGDARKAHDVLNWTCRVAFPDLVEMMMRADLERVARGG